MTMEWALIAAIIFGAMIYCARLMRNGLTTLDESRQRYLERIQDEETKIANDRKNMSSLEHMHVMRAAVEDLLRLEGCARGFSMRSDERAITLETPDGLWLIELVMREHALKSANRTLHGKSRWHLSGQGHSERHNDPASLMQSLYDHLKASEISPDPEPPHLAARIARLPGRP